MAEQERRGRQRPLRKGYWLWHYEHEGAQGMCCAAVQSPAAHLHPETDTETGKGHHTVEDIMLGPGTQEGAPQTPQMTMWWRPLRDWDSPTSGPWIDQHWSPCCLPTRRTWWVMLWFTCYTGLLSTWTKLGDFSSAFNTIQPLLLGDKLRAMQVSTCVQDNGLPDRQATVCRTEELCVRKCEEQHRAPQGAVL